MISERVKVIQDEWGLSQREFCVLLDIENVSASIISQWRAGKKTPQLKTVEALGEVTGSATGWLVGNTEDRWSDKVKAARVELRNWIRHSEVLQAVSPQRRLVAVWDKWYELTGMREEIWAAYLRLVRFERVRVGDDLRLSLEGWKDIVGGMHPLLEPMKKASTLTGVPVTWFTHGDVSELGSSNQDDVVDMINFIKTRTLTLDQLESMYTLWVAMNKPR